MKLPRPRSIGQKLIGLIATLLTLTVTVLTVYFPARQMAVHKRNLIARAETYDALVAGQVESAIAFRDRETAREVLGSLSSDPAVKTAVLYTADGTILYSLRAPGASTREAALQAKTRMVTATDEHVMVVRPVLSREGPRGVLVIELSTAGLREIRRRLTVTAIAVGGAVLLLGIFVARVIAGSLAGRLRRIAEAASRVSEGNLQHAPVPDDSPDEIGTLTRAFNAMLAQLQELIANIQDLARREQDTLSEANRTLEVRVEDRTRELRAANEELQRQMEERQKIELELHQAQKLESVGRLAAGIAHEINTPIQFVGNNITFLETSFADLLQLCSVYRQLCEKAATAPLGPEGLAAAGDAESAADLDFVRENVPRSIAATQDGIGRVARIVQSMKSFAHPDQGQKTTADLNAALRSTITVASNELKYVADVTTDLGEIPGVPCYLGDLNQVFLNLLVNAAHAIADVVGKSGQKGTIHVKTAVEGDGVVISISDSGTGIPEHVRSKIFDPFFTTKDVGKGTGQGLALARSVVVDKHQGTLTFETEMGKGTTFYIRLPLMPEPSVAAPAEEVGRDRHA